GRGIGADSHVQTGRVTLNDATSPHFAGFDGRQNNYGVFQFTVASGQNRLDASIAWRGDPAFCLPPNFCHVRVNSRVRLILVDPLGRFAAPSLPQGPGNFGNVDVTAPVAGRWTGVIFGDVASAGGTNSVVPWRVATQRYIPFGSITPGSLLLAPGASATVNVSASTPSSPGDAAGSIVID